MKNEMMMFANESFGEIRVVEVDGKVLFCGSDIAKALGYTRPTKAIQDHCKGVLKQDILTNGGNQTMSFIPEGDIYRLIVKSKLPQAAQFETWVFDDVLPSIRKNGGYIANQENLTPEQIVANALIVAQSIISEKDRLLLEKDNIIIIQEPKVKGYDVLMDSKGDIDFAGFVKSAKLTLGRNKFIDFLRGEKIIMQGRTEPMQQYINQDYFKVIQVASYGGHSNSKTLITKKGMDWLFRKCREWNLISNNEN